MADGKRIQSDKLKKVWQSMQKQSDDSLYKLYEKIKAEK